MRRDERMPAETGLGQCDAAVALIALHDLLDDAIELLHSGFLGEKG